MSEGKQPTNPVSPEAGEAGAIKLLSIGDDTYLIAKLEKPLPANADVKVGISIRPGDNSPGLADAPDACIGVNCGCCCDSLVIV